MAVILKRMPGGVFKLLFDFFFFSSFYFYLKITSFYFPPSHLQSGLEKSIESAIAEGDYGKAEELSDRLATREVCCPDKPSRGAHQL